MSDTATQASTPLDGSAQARLAAFEGVLASIKEEHARTCARVEALKAQGKTSTATFRQSIARKLQLAEMLSTFAEHGLS